MIGKCVEDEENESWRYGGKDGTECDVFGVVHDTALFYGTGAPVWKNVSSDAFAGISVWAGVWLAVGAVHRSHCSGAPVYGIWDAFVVSDSYKYGV